MDTHYVMSLVRAYGRAVRERRGAEEIEKARQRALMALGHSGVLGNMESFLASYAEHSHRCSDRSVDLEERGTAGGRAIQVITHLEKAVRKALRDQAAPPTQPRPEIRPWTVQVQVFTPGPVSVWANVGLPFNVRAAGGSAEVALKLLEKRDLGDQYRVRVWRGLDADTRYRPAMTWPPAYRD